MGPRGGIFGASARVRPRAELFTAISTRERGARRKRAPREGQCFGRAPTKCRQRKERAWAAGEADGRAGEDFESEGNPRGLLTTHTRQRMHTPVCHPHRSVPARHRGRSSRQRFLVPRVAGARVVEEVAPRRIDATARRPLRRQATSAPCLRASIRAMPLASALIELTLSRSPGGAALRHSGRARAGPGRAPPGLAGEVVRGPALRDHHVVVSARYRRHDATLC